MPRRRRLLLVGAVVLAGVVAAVLVVVVRGDDDDETTPTTAAPTTDPAPTTSVTTDGGRPPIDLTFTPLAEATEEAQSRCLSRDEVLVLDADDGDLRLGRTEDPALPSGSGIDARAVEWVVDKGDDPPTDPAPEDWDPGDSGFRYPVDVRNRDDQPRDGLCLVGGRVSSPYPDRAGDRLDALGWDLLWHKTTAMAFWTPRATVVGTTFHQVGDGIDFEGEDAEGWSVVGVRMGVVHDDCVEADQRTSGRIVDSLLDGCYQGISTYSRGRPDTGAEVLVTGSLIRLQPMQASYRPDRSGRPSNGDVFKWDPEGPRVVLRDVVIRADQIPFQAYPFAMPDDIDCEGATFVWGGAEPLPEQGEGFMRCFDDDGEAPFGDRITTDTSVWDDAVAAWEAARPG